MNRPKRKKAKSCWQFWSCPELRREKCHAFKEGFGKDCWRFKTSFARKPGLEIKDRFANCSDCPWFRKFHPLISFLYQENLM